MTRDAASPARQSPRDAPVAPSPAAACSENRAHTSRVTEPTVYPSHTDRGQTSTRQRRRASRVQQIALRTEEHGRSESAVYDAGDRAQRPRDGRPETVMMPELLDRALGVSVDGHHEATVQRTQRQSTRDGPSRDRQVIRRPQSSDTPVRAPEVDMTQTDQSHQEDSRPADSGRAPEVDRHRQTGEQEDTVQRALERAPDDTDRPDIDRDRVIRDGRPETAGV